jgi:hypothetical protein
MLVAPSQTLASVVVGSSKLFSLTNSAVIARTSQGGAL